MRVLMVSPQFRPIVGGYEVAAERLAIALASAGLSIVLITERRDRTWPKEEVIEGLTVKRLWCWYRRYLHVVTSLMSFAIYLLRHGRAFNVWHVHQYGAHAALAVAIGKALHRPVVLKLTSSGAMGIGETLGHGVVGRVLGYFHRRVSACIAVTEETRVDAIRFGIPAQRVHVVPNGVDGQKFRPASPEQRIAARQSLTLKRKFVVLCIGRLSSEKNHLGLLDAWAAIDAGTRADALLALVGDGPNRQAVITRAHAPDVANSVLLAGQRSDVVTWYQAANIFVISSVNEGLSNTMIEALASGLPVVSTRVSGSSILLEYPVSGVVVDVGSSAELTRALERLLKHDALRIELGHGARRAFESNFSLGAISERMTLLYAGLLARTEQRVAV